MQRPCVDLVIVGRLWAERIACAPALPRPAETVEATTFDELLGGRGARQAVAAAHLGMPPGFVASAGMDVRGDRLCGWLLEENVDPWLVRCDSRLATGAALVQVDRHRARQTVIFPDAARAVSPADVDAAASVLATARVLLVSLELPREVAVRAAGLAHLDGVLVVLDAAGATSHSREQIAADVVHAGIAQARALTGVQVVGPDTARTAAELLLAHGLRAVERELADRVISAIRSAFGGHPEPGA